MLFQSLLLLSSLWARCAFAATESFPPPQTFYTENFTVPAFVVNRTGPNTEGLLIMGVLAGSYIKSSPLIMQDNGQLVWYGGDPVSENNQVIQYNGDPGYAYFTGFRNSFGQSYGRVQIFDTNYDLARSVCLHLKITTPNPKDYPGTRKNACYFDHHESYFTDYGTMIGTVFNVTQQDLRPLNGPKDGWIFDSMFAEVDVATDKVLFTWSSIAHVPITKSNYRGTDPSQPLKFRHSTLGNTQSKPWDYFHINSVQPIKGGYYLVSSRFCWSIYLVNGKTGAIEWTLEGSQGGDFDLAPGLFWSWQHHVREVSIKNHIWQISMFNNDNINSIIKVGTNQSEGLLLGVNMQTKQVTALRDLKTDYDPIVSVAMGSYQVLDKGAVLVGYGKEAVIREFDAANNMVYQAQFSPLVGLSGGDNSHTYRVYRQNWTSTPNYPPKAAAFANETGVNTTVYMSWNGATTVDSWNVYAGLDNGTLVMVASDVPKDGFETMTMITPGGLAFDYVQVEALGGGQSLAKSEPVQVQGSGGGSGGGQGGGGGGGGGLLGSLENIIGDVL